MKDIIERLLKKYYDIRMILPRTIVTQDKGKTNIQIFDDLAPNLWGMYEQSTVNQTTGMGKLDIPGALTIQDNERSRIAKQIFNLTKTILKQQTFQKKTNIEHQWNQEYGNVTPNENASHEAVSYTHLTLPTNREV